MEKILIVNDNNNLQDILSFSLGYGGYRIVHDVNGKQALMLAERDKPKVIILNAMMTNVDSFGLCQKIKASPALANSFVMILTEAAKASDKTKDLEVGADYYMTMPFDTVEFITVLSGVRKR